MGRLGVKNPVTSASHCYVSSIRSITSLVKFIARHSLFELDTHIDAVCSAKDYDHASLSEQFTVTFDHLLPQLACLQHHTVLRVKEFNVSGCLYYHLKRINLTYLHRNLEMLWLCATVNLC